MIYLIGSLRNPEVPKIANKLRDAGFDVFDDWFAAGPDADDKWRDYERGRGRSFREALSGYAARHVFAFDREHLERASDVVLVCPAGKSGHLELGWALGKGKRGYILIDSPDRWDVMYQFADGVFDSVEELIGQLATHRDNPHLHGGLTQVGQVNAGKETLPVFECAHCGARCNSTSFTWYSLSGRSRAADSRFCRSHGAVLIPCGAQDGNSGRVWIDEETSQASDKDGRNRDVIRSGAHS